MTLTELFTNIANAIRSKKGTSDKINATDFATEIENIQTGGGDVSEYFTETIGAGTNTSISGFDKSIKKAPMYIVLGTSAKYMFSQSQLTTIPQLDTSNVTNMDSMFYECSFLTEIPLLNTSNVTSMNNMFRSCTTLSTIPQLDTSNVTNMSYMFYSCPKLTTIPLLNTSNVTSMDNMFQNCTTLSTIPQLDTSNVTNMSGIFRSCLKLTEIPLLNTSNVTSMGSMFYECHLLTEIPQLDTSNVTNMGYMFYSCKALTTIPQLDTSNVTNMNYIFQSVTKLTNLGGFLNLGKGYTTKQNNYRNYSLNLSNSNQLTHDSLMNIINNLYDLNLTYDVANGGTLYTQQLQLGSTNLAKLTAEEIAIATNKGWTVS